MGEEGESALQAYDEWVGSQELEDFTELAGEGMWKGRKTRYMVWFERLKDTVNLQDVFGEEEDEVSSKYKVLSALYFAMKFVQQRGADEGKELDNTKGKVAGVRGIGATANVEEEEFVLRSVDQYGELTLQLLAARIKIEQVDCMYHRVILFYLNLVQFCFAIVVFGIGAQELEGGQFEPVVATTVAGVVSVIASIFGVLGSIGENEGYLRKYLVGGFWLLAILTTFLYVEIYMLNNESIKCNPSNQSFTPSSSDGCIASEGRHSALVAIAFIKLLIVFYGAMTTINLLDSINDQSGLVSKQLLLNYMRTRLYEAKLYMQKYIPDICTTRRMQLLDDDMFTT